MVTVTFNPSPGGSVSVPSIQVPKYSKIYVEDDIIWFGNQSKYSAMAVPDEGYAFASWSVTGGTVTSDMTIVVTFKEISGIEISKAPDHLDYKEGEMFDPAGLVILVTFADGTTMTVEYEGHESKFAFTPPLDTPLKSGDETVTVSYGGKSAAQDITVDGSCCKCCILWWIILVIVLILIAVLLYRRYRS